MLTFLLIAVIVILLIRWMFRRFIHSLFEHTQAKNRPQTSKQPKSAQASKSNKVIQSNVGEYVDYEEIKD